MTDQNTGSPPVKHPMQSLTIWWHSFLLAVGGYLFEFSQQAAPLVDQLGPAGMPPQWVARVGLLLALVGIVGGGLRIKTYTGLSLKGDGQ